MDFTFNSSKWNLFTTSMAPDTQYPTFQCAIFYVLFFLYNILYTVMHFYMHNFCFYLNLFQVPRTEWVLNWPGQIVIAGCQTFWTTEVSEALEKRDLKGLYTNLLEQVSYAYNVFNYITTQLNTLWLSCKFLC